MTTRRMTVGQALVAFLAHQWTVDGGLRERTVPAVFGILGHGNVAGLGQALVEAAAADKSLLPFHQVRNEQAAVHQAVGYARIHRRRATYACTSSVGPGATNMLTGAALATANRLPALLLPSDTFATRVADPVLQQIELPHDPGISVNDAFRPLSRFFDRVQRPEQLFSIALGAMRVLTDPAETGAVTIALPEDVQAEAVDVPAWFLADREWHLRRPPPERDALRRAAVAVRGAEAPFVVAGGGVLYAAAEEELRQLVESTGIPVATTQAGGGALRWDHPQYLGGAGATGSAAANRIAADADLVIGVGTRYSDFTTASGSAFQRPGVRFLNINVVPLDAAKQGSSLPLVADAREALRALRTELEEFRVGGAYEERVRREKAHWDAVVDRALTPSGRPVPSQAEVIGAVQAAMAPEDVLVQAAGSLPGDLHKLWRVRDPLGYHVEYAFSCMGYEIAGGLGVRRGLQALGDRRDVVVMVGDGSYLMLSSELAAAAAEGLKLVVVLVQNHGYASIGNLSEQVGSQRFGTRLPPVDLAANARSYGVEVVEVAPGPGVVEEVRAAVEDARASPRTTVIHVQTDPLLVGPDGEGWWDVPVAEVSDLESTRRARVAYVEERERRRPPAG